MGEEMESFEGEASADLLQSQAHLWNHIFSFINSMSLKCAVELGIPDAVHRHGKPISVPELAAALSIPPARTACLRRLMRLLVHSGFFANGEGDDMFSPTAVSTLLLKENEASVSPFLLLVLDNSLLLPWQFLGAWFKGDGPPTAFELAHGEGIWDATDRRPELNALLNEGMASDACLVTKLVIGECGEVFRGLSSLVDVGGGTGRMARAIAEAFPHVRCIVFDLPQVAAAAGESEAVKVVAGDMFEYIPPADAMLLKWVLHDWSDEECVKILEKCKEAIPSREEGGKVIIVEMVMRVGSSSHEWAETQLLFDMHMMAHTTGKQRCEGEWSKIFKAAGFTGYNIIPALGLRSIIEVYP